MAPARGSRGRPGRTLAAVRRTYQDALHAYFGVLVEHLSAHPGADKLASYAAGGLRAGYYRFADNRVTLHHLSYVPGVQVSGRLRSLVILPNGVLRIRGRTAAHGTLRVRDGLLSGRLAGVRVRGRLGPDIFDLLLGTIAPSASAARNDTPARPVHPRLTALDPRPAQWMSDRLRG